MRALVLVEHNNKQMHPSTRNTFAAALKLDPNPVCIVVGHNCQEVAQQAAILAGASKVIVVDNACYEHQLAENVTDVVVSIATPYSTILAPATTFGKNILPRIAALLDMAQLSDVIEIVDSETFVHPIYAGNALETVKILDSIKIMTIRGTAFAPDAATQAPCEIEILDTIIPCDKTQFTKQELNQSKRPELSSANIVVAGGRGLQNAEKFKLIEELADVLGAAVGASRAAVDAGFVPNDYQVGQTGKIVAPALYIAIGISGAVQHLAGMKDAKVIVAINKDPDAPIFQIADYGLVGDLFELVPQLIEQLKE
jgi:electron transfer flavoprotein alpha subunit